MDHVSLHTSNTEYKEVEELYLGLVLSPPHGRDEHFGADSCGAVNVPLSFSSSRAVISRSDPNTEPEPPHG